MKAIHWEVIRQGVRSVLYDIEVQGTALPYPYPPIRDIDDLNGYLSGLDFQDALDDAVDYTRFALIQAGAALAEAHDLAAKVAVASPTAADLKTIVNNLDQLSEAIKEDQRFHAALALASAISDIVVALK